MKSFSKVLLLLSLASSLVSSLASSRPIIVGPPSSHRVCWDDIGCRCSPEERLEKQNSHRAEYWREFYAKSVCQFRTPDWSCQQFSTESHFGTNKKLKIKEQTSTQTRVIIKQEIASRMSSSACNSSSTSAQHQRLLTNELAHGLINKPG